MTIVTHVEDRDALLEQDQRFFDDLVAADAARLEELLTEDFVLVAVNDGSTVTRADLLEAITSGGLRFPAIQPHHAEAIVRRFGDVGIVVGRTSMSFTGPDGTDVTTGSRYTHVFTQDGTAGWRLVSAQGTPIG
jgi:ketosteroid isomerase-like protein